MSTPSDLLWQMQPWVPAKHAILSRYLSAWFPILGQRNPHIVYIDGFAGPGRYAGGEAGSPLIALECALSAKKSLRDTEVHFFFIEAESSRADRLRREISTLSLPLTFKVHVHTGDFADVIGSALDELDSGSFQLAPTFAFIDPFGVRGVPFRLVERLVSRKRCEALITFMTQTAQRFNKVIPEALEELFGDAAAVAAIQEHAGEREQEARRQYQRSLMKAARFVRPFSMRSTNGSAIYDLFFATNHELGNERMKEAMCAVDETGAFRFSAGENTDQLRMFTDMPAQELARELLIFFSGRRVAWEDVRSYARSSPQFIENHAREALRLLERNPADSVAHILVEPQKLDGSKRRAGTFPEGTMIRFPAARGTL